MRKPGQVTVFLSMILLCVCALLCSVVESARMAGTRCYLQTAADSAIDSVMSGYHRELWDSYRLLLRECGDQKELEEEFTHYFGTYFEQEGWYPAAVDEVTVKKADLITEEAGRLMEKEILDYMKYGIWTMDFSPEEAGKLKENLKEAQAVGRTAEIYAGHTRDAVRIEEALENLDSCLERQKSLKKEGIQALQNCDGSRFKKIAKEMIRELNRVPGLVETYEKKADELNEKLVRSKAQFRNEADDMGIQASAILEREISQYESYTSKDGERRMEIEEETVIAEKNRQLTEEVMREAENVEDYIENWEGDDEEEELDEEALWRPVMHHFEKLQEGRVTCPHGVQDKEKKHILEKLKNMADGSLLDLVMPEGKHVSEKKAAADGLLSAVYGKSQENERAGLTDRLLTSEYCGKFFGNFIKEEDHPLQYEMEYLAEGELSDRSNLTGAVREIFLIREGLNLLHILSDGAKREEAMNLAAALVGASGLAPLVLLVAFLIMNLWAAAEAISDLKILMSGGKMPLWKSSEDWRLGLEGMMEAGRTGTFGNSEGSERGQDYTGYLKVLLYIEERVTLYYRIMDVIQLNIRAEQPDFSIGNCAYAVDIQAKICGKHMFFLPGIVDNPPGNQGYDMAVRVRKAY
ncbi:DUF5702 domain-containing protein [Clostridium sp. AM58-1XD]|uniref:DUF5702 domain-containing protein n=1 Tax=Clostridium sp. AM58-1XD TaxID=2292307 RepID=UPI000E52D3C9|nr:DUF5702 domain-containing protein [Clostridium sp. AM58-1XD]RGY97356.1 hypothetical protein DXA13_14615 [Clostridium sp. AM58-1XD]